MKFFSSMSSVGRRLFAPGAARACRLGVVDLEARPGPAAAHGSQRVGVVC